MDEKIYISIIKSNDNYYIKLNRSSAVEAFKTETEGVRFFEDGYNRHIQSGAEGAASACLNNMFFSPSIVCVEGLKEIKKIVGDHPKPYSLSHVSGYMVALMIPDINIGEDYWNKGVKPRLSKG